VAGHAVYSMTVATFAFPNDAQAVISTQISSPNLFPARNSRKFFLSPEARCQSTADDVYSNTAG
jgi:hypothetical protein